MSLSDPLANMLTIIRNGQMRHLAVVHAPDSKLHRNVLDVLKNEGFIRDYSAEEKRKGVSELSIELKYAEGAPVIKKLKRVSKPGRRVYASIKDLPKVYNGLGVSIISTSDGVMPDHEARVKNVGGEVLCSVF